MKDISGILKNRAEEGKASVLVTVVEDKGSAPRSAGACMVVGEKGRLAGSIGGGMLEFKATQTAVEALAAGRGELKKYRLTKSQAAELGMICGGNVDVLFSYISADKCNAKAVGELHRHLTGNMTGWMILPYSGTGIGFLGVSGFFGAMPRTEKTSVTAVKLGTLEAEGEIFYIQKLLNDSRVYVFGGGHLAQELVPLISHLGFRCVVTDDRAEFSTKELFPDAEELHTLEYDKLEGEFDIRPQDFIVIISRGHMGDYEVQRWALTTSAYYIGAVGSRGKIAMVNAKLRDDGFTEEDISRVTAPIGIAIRSETPAEIAVSIAGQLIERRASYNNG